MSLVNEYLKKKEESTPDSVYDKIPSVVLSEKQNLLSLKQTFSIFIIFIALTTIVLMLIPAPNKAQKKTLVNNQQIKHLKSSKKQQIPPQKTRTHTATALSNKTSTLKKAHSLITKIKPSQLSQHQKNPLPLNLEQKKLKDTTNALKKHNTKNRLNKHVPAALTPIPSRITDQDHSVIIDMEKSHHPIRISLPINKNLY